MMWGTSYILIKRSLLVFTPLELGSLRTSIAALCFLPVAIRHFKSVTVQEWKYLVSIGCLGILFPAFLFPLAQTHLASALTGILNALTGLSTLVVGALFFKQKITTLRVAGILLGIIGTALLIFSGASSQVTTNAIYGIFVVLATICNALNANVTKSYLAHMPTLKMSALGLFTVGPIAFIYFCTTAAPAKIIYTAAGLKALGLVSILALVSTYLIPIVALAWGVLDGERITATHYLGMITILSGVYLVSRNR